MILRAILIPLLGLFLLPFEMKAQANRLPGVTSDRDSLRELAVRMFREKNGLGKDTILTLDQEPLRILNSYLVFQLHESRSDEQALDKVILSEDGRFYSQGSITALKENSEAGIRASFLVSQAKAHEAHISGMELSPDGLFESGFIVDPLQDVPKKIPFRVDLRQMVAIFGTVYDVMSDGEQDRLTLQDATVILGSNHPTRTLVIFSDFECPYCAAKESALPIRERLESDSELRVIFRDFPLPYHPWAMTAAKAAACVYKLSPNQYLDFRARIFALQERLSATTAASVLRDKAVGAGLDAKEFEECQHAPETQHSIEKDIEAGKRLQLALTPTMYLNGRVLLDEEELKKSAPSAADKNNCERSCPVR